MYKRQVRFVVLKRGHSGSTWFSALLQELHLTFFMDEALSAKALAGASRDDVAKYLDAALAAPAGQFQSSARPKPIQWRAQSRRAERCHVRRRGCDLAAVGLGVAPLARRRRTAPPDWFAAVLAAVQQVYPEELAEPAGFSAAFKLRPYQRQSLAFCVNAERQTGALFGSVEALAREMQSALEEGGE